VSAAVTAYSNLAFDVVERIERLVTSVDVIQCFGEALRQFGFTSFLITDVPDLALHREPIFLLNGWPPEWTEMYTRENLYQDDPIAGWGRQTVQPYEWSDVRVDAQKNPQAAHVMNVASEFKLREGFVVPIYMPGQPMSAVTMGGEQPDFDPVAKRAIHLISMYSHSRVVALSSAQSQPNFIPLTDKEKEVLLWTAAGKSSWEIASILGITVTTVNWRIKQALIKLNAVNKIQAVVKAIRTKQISV